MADADKIGTSAITLPQIARAATGNRHWMYPTTLAADTTLVAGTYYMTANCDCASKKLTFNCASGSIIVKRSGDYYHTNQGAVDTTNSTSSNKVYWTVKNDDTIGEIITGSTGSPAVTGGSWGNATAMTGIVNFVYWEIRWVDNKNFITANSTKTFSYVTWKNCVYSSVSVLYITADSNVQATYSRLSWDNTNTISGTAKLIGASSTSIGNKFVCDYIYVQSANTSTPLIQFNVYYNSAVTRVYTYWNINNVGSGYGAQQYNSRVLYEMKHCRFRFQESSGGGGPYTVIFRNCLFDNGTIGLNRDNTAGIIQIRLFNCIFSGLTTAAIQSDNTTTTTTYIIAVRNCIFDSNAKIVGNAYIGYLTAIKNNGYYNNTSEANWTRGSYDTSISAPSWSNFPSGTLHTDWTTYGPGDGWYTTQDIATGADTNGMLSLNLATQSHTGLIEVATTQRLGIAPTFSVLA